MKLSPNFEDALIYATQAHCDQTRKKTGIPYIAHVLGVTAIALEYGANETEAIGALLHDTVEDCGGAERLRDIQNVTVMTWRRSSMAALIPTKFRNHRGAHARKLMLHTSKIPTHQRDSSRRRTNCTTRALFWPISDATVRKFSSDSAVRRKELFGTTARLLPHSDGIAITQISSTS